MTSPLSIVHNRTTTAAHDQMKAREKADADRRRAHLDKQRSATRADPVGAKLHTHALGGVGTHAAAVIRIMHKDGTTKSYETCELSVDAEGTLTLIVVCPACVFRHGRPMGDSQLTMRSNHRKFVLDPVGQGNQWHNPENPAEVVQLAGAIETIDVQTCPVCHFRFHIEKSKDQSDIRGVSVFREA